MNQALAVALEAPRPRPFLKWAGGKTQLLPELMARVPSRFNRYFEPFMGGGALFFALAPQRAVLSDINSELVSTYRSLRDDVGGVIRALDRHRSEERHFYEVRAQGNARLSASAAAARMIFLNRTCFNGLYRVNRSGQFNVPFGKYKNPTICDADNLRRVAQVLDSVQIETRNALSVGRYCRRGDFVYFDPPYDPVSPTASFTGYTQGGFGRPEQERLAEVFARLAERGVQVMLSNSDTPFIRKLYRQFNVERVYARRAINRNATGRGRVAEVLVTCS